MHNFIKYAFPVNLSSAINQPKKNRKYHIINLHEFKCNLRCLNVTDRSGFRLNSCESSYLGVEEEKEKKNEMERARLVSTSFPGFSSWNLYPSQFLKRCLSNEVGQHRKLSLIVGPN